MQFTNFNGTIKSGTLQQQASAVAMPSSFPQLDALKVDARQVGTILCPIASLQSIILQFANGLQIPLAVAPVYELPQPAPHAGIDPGDFDPTPLQMRMIQFLAAGPKSPTQMKNHTHGHMYDSPGGVNELIELGIVEKKFSKLRLTEIGQGIAAEIGDEEPEG